MYLTKYLIYFQNEVPVGSGEEIFKLPSYGCTLRPFGGKPRE